MPNHSGRDRRTASHTFARSNLFLQLEPCAFDAERQFADMGIIAEVTWFDPDDEPELVRLIESQADRRVGGRDAPSEGSEPVRVIVEYLLSGTRPADGWIRTPVTVAGAALIEG